MKFRRLDVLDSRKRLLLAFLLLLVLSSMIAVFHRLDRPVDETSGIGFIASYGWIVAQAGWPLGLVCGIGMLAARLTPTVAYCGAYGVMCLLPILLILDTVSFHWVGERFLSPVVFYMVTQLAPDLLHYATSGTLVMTFVIAALTVAGMFAVDRLATIGSRRWRVDRGDSVSPSTAWVVAMGLLVLASVPAYRQWPSLRAAMADHSSRHPWCALHFVKHRGVGVSQPRFADAVKHRVEGIHFAPLVYSRIDRWKSLEFRSRSIAKSSTDLDTQRPDVLIVVIESLQRSMLTSETMPRTSEMASESLWLKNHYSGGNCTSLGFFSLMVGKEAVWFPVQKSLPVTMNEVFHHHDYKIGFFAGVDSYDNFNMDHVINEDCYDAYYAPPTQWLKTDQAATDLASDFLNRRDLPKTSTLKERRRPRVAVLYLFSTHSPFAYFPEDEKFKPSSSDRYTIPFGEDARLPIYNRYRNSVRSIDRMIAPLLSKDKILVVTADHGEALLEDGSVGHGYRANAIQNQTPAIIYVPGGEPRQIEATTSHIDILPTIFAACGIDFDDEGLLDGVNLSAATDAAIDRRIIATCNYVGDEMLLVCPPETRPRQPLGLRANFGIGRWLILPFNAVDQQGLEYVADTESASVGRSPCSTERMFERWLDDRFETQIIPLSGDHQQALIPFLQDDDWRIRRDALEIANEIDKPTDALVRCVGKLVFDSNESLSIRAKKIWTTLQKRVAASR